MNKASELKPTATSLTIWQQWKRKATLFVLAIVPLQIGCCVVYKYVLPPITIIQAESLILKSRSFDRTYIDGKKVSFHLYHALIGSEDTSFAHHNGFDIEGIKEALRNKTGGGSTITQQAVKNALLWKEPAILRKVGELYLTPTVEKIWGKERTLEIYVNIIEFEDGVYGIESAAKKFYHKSAKNLTKREAIEIVSCIPQPKGCLRYRVHTKPLKLVQAHIRKEMKALERDVPTMELIDQVTGAADVSGALKP
ncbi:transglycosylase domain-containing protein [Chamaesiphon minutus]|uniref:Transglycosylase n=1 Tax=Chamaesiphon minutus (strain ATCC 27169 / PCC 6605) TaxID=1173020 RepID=K9UCJ6_CHAP6|nr:transglycosylase domain-containing protein [Chamaesiphon minutus]AFY92560.1 Transglycosylase [Chamaesiphon minutus PCC 6605]